ncbi:MAG TPA: helix-turn-helix domain-containing protein [Microlunatus sp.]
MSRSYGQLCGLALALDAIGDRWSLLIVRELLVRPEGARYTDLRDGLPGIATNLLADRLRQLEVVGVLHRVEPRPPVATPIFRLTELGQGLRTPVSTLAVWGGEQVPMASGDDDFRSRWLIIPIEAMLRDSTPDAPTVIMELVTGDEPVIIEIGAGEVRARTVSSRPEVRVRPSDLMISGPPKAMLGVLSGKLPLTAATRLGVGLVGDESVLTRVGLSSA